MLERAPCRRIIRHLAVLGLYHRVVGWAAVGAVVAVLHGSAQAATISGTVFHSTNANPVRTATVELFYDGDDAEAGRLVPAELLGANQQGQRPVGDGGYRFDVRPGRRYALVVRTDSTSFRFPSTRIPARDGFAPLGAVVSSSRPTATPQHVYYLRFAIDSDADNVTNNHVPLDPPDSHVSLTKTADRVRASVGDIVHYTIRAENQSGRNFTRADSRPLYIIDTPPATLRYAPGKAVATLSADQTTALRTPDDFNDASEGTRSRRIIRFGPFDLPAGATLVLRYQAMVTLDGTPGLYQNSAIATADNVAVSSQTSVKLHVVHDEVIDHSVIIGRVFCDRDNDGKFGDNDAGYLHARVYIDTGSYAQTDASGRYHFSRVPTGTHVVKLDTDTLGGGRIARPTRLVRTGSGAAMRANFPVRCVSQRITQAHVAVVSTGKRKHATKSPSPEGVKSRRKHRVRADLRSLRLVVDGKPIELPRADLSMVPPPNHTLAKRAALNAPHLRAVPSRGYAQPITWQLNWRTSGGEVARWTLAITRLDGERAVAVKEFTGVGQPPKQLTWNGLRDDGSTATRNAYYRAQFTIVGATRPATATSAFTTFAIALPDNSAPSAAGRHIWRGALFAARRPYNATAELTRKVAALARGITAGAKIQIEAHWDGTGDRLAALARTQREARIVADLFVQAGVKKSAIAVHGRGSLELLKRGKDATTRALNRRVVIVVKDSGPPPAPAKPPRATDVAKAWINGDSIAVTDSTTAEVVTVADANGSLLVDLLATDGRRAKIDVGTKRSPRRQVPPAGEKHPKKPDSTNGASPQTRVPVHVDLSTNQYQVRGQALNRSILNIQTSIQGASQEIATIAATSKRSGSVVLHNDVVFAIDIPQSIRVRSWKLNVRDASGRSVASASPAGTSAMKTVRWPRASTMQLTPGQLYSYELSVVEHSGDRGISPRRYFTVGAPLANPGKSMGVRGRLFTRGARLTARLKNMLSTLVSKATARGPKRNYHIEAKLAVNDNATEQLATRSRAIRKYLTQLGLAGTRYELQLSASEDGKESLTIAPLSGQPTTPAPPKPVPGLVINGRKVGLAGSRYATDISAAPNSTVIVDITTATGARGVFLSKPARPTQRRQRRPNAHNAKDPRLDQPPREPSLPQLPQFEIVLPPRTATLASRELGVVGRTRPGSRIAIYSSKRAFTRVQDNGAFATVVTLPVGASTLHIEVIDANGKRAHLKWPIRVSTTSLFTLALVEGIVGSAFTRDGWSATEARPPGITDSSSTRLGPLMLHGRAVAYVKGRRTGGQLFGDVEFTAHVDTAKRNTRGAFFDQVFGSETGLGGDFPIYGNAASEVRDVNARGPVYLSVRADDSKLTIGSIYTGLSPDTLFQYDRTVEGALVDATGTLGKHRMRLKSFVAGSGGDAASDINWYRATGGSLYYLRHGRVLEGSERVRVIVRDRDTGVVVDERLLHRNTDYTVDYQGGRLMLASPVPAISRSSWVIDNFDGRVQAGGGHPTFISVRYEHTDLDRSGNWSAGVHASDSYRGVQIAGGFTTERTNEQDHSLFGAVARIKLGARSKFSAEMAGSRALSARTTLSQDGGMRFGRLNHLTLGEPSAGTRLAWRTQLATDWRDFRFLPKALRHTRLSAFAQSVEVGFTSETSALDAGRIRAGALLEHDLNARSTLRLRYLAEVAELPQVGPRPADIMANPTPDAPDERATTLAAIQYEHRRGRWVHRLEANNHRISSTAALVDNDPVVDVNRLGIGAQTAFHHSKHLTVRFAQQAVLGLGDHDPHLHPLVSPNTNERDARALAGITSSVGADVHVAPSVKLTSDWFQRWNGDNAGQLGLTSALSDTGSYYIRERVSMEGTRSTSTTIIGAEDAIAGTAGGKSYGEYHIEAGGYGPRNRAVLGLGNRWQLLPGFAAAVGFEHQQLFGGFLPDGTPIGDNQRNVAFVGAEYTRKRTVKASIHFELRLDNGLDPTQFDNLVDDDPRPDGTGFYPDHGGTSPGAPLALPSGDTRQLLGTAAIAWKWHLDHTALARVRASTTQADNSGGDFTAAEFFESTIGWAYTPERRDWFNLLVRYSILHQLRPISVPNTGTRETAHVGAVIPIIDLPHRLVLSAKMAFKVARAKDAQTTPGQHQLSTTTSQLLWLGRLGYRFYGNWDAALESRWLLLEKPVGIETKSGTLIELGYNLNRWTRLGAGYNFSRFSDNELDDLTRDSHGWFLRATAHY